MGHGTKTFPHRKIALHLRTPRGRMFICGTRLSRHRESNLSSLRHHRHQSDTGSTIDWLPSGPWRSLDHCYSRSLDLALAKSQSSAPNHLQNTIKILRFFWDCESLAVKIKALLVRCQHEIVPIRFFLRGPKALADARNAERAKGNL